MRRRRPSRISIHALREEGDAGPAFPRCRPAISIHALREEGDAVASGPLITTINDISIHALREEGDVIRASSSITICEFLSTPSARRATHQDCPEKGCNKNFYPRPPRGGRRYLARPERHDLRISIHALREEGDWSGSIRWAQHSHFYPRPPRGGRRILYWFDFTFTEFLSTPSARRATPTHRRMNPPPSYFYPRPPRGGRPIIL